jgi:PAS domain S-box-containing protein
MILQKIVTQKENRDSTLEKVAETAILTPGITHPEENEIHNPRTMSVKLLSNSSRQRNRKPRIGHPQQSISEIIANGFFTVDQKWTVKYWNKSAEKILNVRAEDIIEKNLWEVFEGEIPPDFYKTYHQALLKDIPAHFEEYWEKKGAWFDAITYYHCDNTLSVSFKSSNQTELPETRLKVLNDLYRFVTEITNDCLWEWNLQAKEIFWIDGGHKRVFGYHIENALIPQSFWESRIHSDDRVRVLAKLDKIIAERSGCLWEDEYRFKRANGEYAYVHDRGHVIYSSDKRACRMIGATQDITANTLLENKLVQERLTSQKEITEAVLTAQENERTTIGKELHDNLNQILGATKMYIEVAKREKRNRQMYLEKSCDLIVHVISEIRKISKNLIIPRMHFVGMFDSIRMLINDLMLIHPLEIDFSVEGLQEDNFDEKRQINIFRIVQEQLNNILKHAKATHAKINLTKQGDKIMLMISDNGKGWDMSEERKGVGIRNIMSRAELCNGNAEILSKPDEGFQLKVILPAS